MLESAIDRMPRPLAAPIYDTGTGEWMYVDQDGIAYYGATPGECYRLAAEDAREEAKHA